MPSSPARTPGARAPRLKVFQPARMVAGATERRVHLLDLSESGALVHSAEPAPAPGAVVTLHLGVKHAPARVVWADGRRFGVRFAVALTRADLDAVLAEQRELIEQAVERIAPRRA